MADRRTRPDPSRNGPGPADRPNGPGRADRPNGPRGPQGRGRGRHPADAVSLVAGVLFCGVAGGWALMSAGILGPGDLNWAVPLLLVLTGIAALVATTAGRDRR